MRLLCASATLCFPETTGDHVRTAGMVRALAQEHEVTLLTTRRPDATDGDVARVAEMVDGRLIVVEPAAPDPSRSVVARAGRWLRALRWRMPPTSIAWKHPAIESRLARTSHDYDAVLFLDNAVVVNWRSARHARCVIVDIHNVAGWSGRSRSVVSDPRGVLIGMLQRSFERRYLAEMDGVFVTSPEEEQRLWALYRRRSDAVIPSAVNADYPERGPTSSRVVGWLGAVAYGPNQDGLQRFVQHGWPLLGNKGFQLRVAGADPPPSIRGLERYPGVSVLGFVADLDEFLGALSAAVVPLWSGAGVKLKTVTFMAAGVPLVATSTAMEGISATDGVEVLIRDDPVDMARAVDALLADPSRAEALGKAAQRLVRDQLTWTSVGQHLLARVDAIVRHSESEAPSRSP